MKKQTLILNEIFYILLVLPALFLLVNIYPYFLVGSVILSVILGIIFFISRRSITSFHKEILGILLITFIYFIASYFFSGQNIPELFSYSFLKRDGNFFFCYILFFVFSISGLNYKKLAKYYFYFLFIVFTGFSFFGILEYLFGKWSLMVITESYTGKLFFGLNTAHNATGSVYAIVCIFILVFFLKEKRISFKLLYSLILIVNLAALFITKSRGSYIGFIIGAIFVLWLHYRSIGKFFGAIGTLTALLISLVYLTGIYKRILQMFDITSIPISFRFELWEKAWYLFSQSPIFGIGFGRFNDIFSIERNEFIISRLKGYPGIFAYYGDQIFYYDASHAHNSYLQLLTETGLIGFILVMVFWILCFVKILKAYLSSDNNSYKKVYLSSAMAIIVLLVLSLTENYLSATTIMIPMAMLTSLAIGLSWQEYIKGVSSKDFGKRKK